MHPSFAQSWERLRWAYAWWLSELRNCIPAGLRSLFQPEPARVMLRAIGLEIWNGRQQVAAVPWPADRPRWDPAFRACRGQRVVLSIDADLALVCPLALPAAAERAIDSALAFEVERRTPFPASETLAGYRLRGRNPVTSILSLDLVCVPHSVIGSVAEALKEGGVSIQRYEVRFADGTVDLLPPKPAGHGPRRSRAAVALWGAAITMTLIGILLPVQRMEAEIRLVKDEIARLRPVAERVNALEGELVQWQERIRRLNAFGREASPLAILSALSRLTPDTTYLTSLQIDDGGSIQVEGQAVSAANLAALIDASPLFNTPSFRAPVVPNQRGEERFLLAVEVEQRVGISEVPQ